MATSPSQFPGLPLRPQNKADFLAKWRAFFVPASYDDIDESTLLDLSEDIAVIMPPDLSQDVEAVRTCLTRSPERTGAGSLTAADLGNVVPVTSATPVTLTVAPGLGQAAPAAGQPGTVRVCFPMQTGPGLVTLAAGPGVSLVPVPNSGLKSTGPGCRWVLSWHDTNTVFVEGGTT